MRLSQNACGNQRACHCGILGRQSELLHWYGLLSEIGKEETDACQPSSSPAVRLSTRSNVPLALCRSGRIAGSKLVHEEAEGLSMTLAVLLQRGEHHGVRRPQPSAATIRSPSPPVRSPSPPVQEHKAQQVLACAPGPSQQRGTSFGDSACCRATTLWHSLAVCGLGTGSIEFCCVSPGFLMVCRCWHCSVPRLTSDRSLRAGWTSVPAVVANEAFQLRAEGTS